MTREQARQMAYELARSEDQEYGEGQIEAASRQLAHLRRFCAMVFEHSGAKTLAESDPE